MKRSVRILALLIASLPLLLPVRPGHAAAHDQASGPVELVVGYSTNAFTDVDIEEARSITKVWTDQILKRKFREGTAQSVIFPDVESIEKAVRERNVDLIAIVSNDYVHLKDHVPLQPVFVTAPESGFYYQIVLLVRRDRGFRDVGDLRRKQLNVSMDQAKTLHMIWLETLLMKEGVRRPEEFFLSIREVRRPSQAILPVFFKQADACLTTRQSFELMCELNPQVGKEMVVLAQSPDVAGGVIAFRPDYREKYKEMLMGVLETLDADPQGRQILKLFRMGRLIPFKPEYLRTVEALYRQHETLQGILSKRK